MKILVFFIFSSLSIFANDVQVINSMHGGMIKKTDTALIEFVTTPEKANVYITDPNKKNLASDKLTISAIANIKGKEVPMNLSFENDHYSLSPYSNLKEENNYVVSFTISFPLPGKTEKAIFKVGK
jgi:superfamily I DNA and RNA helicase